MNLLGSRGSTCYGNKIHAQNARCETRQFVFPVILNYVCPVGEMLYRYLLSLKLTQVGRLRYTAIQRGIPR